MKLLKRMTKRYIKYFLILCVAFLAACNVTKNVPEGDFLYTGAKVKIEDKDVKKKDKKILEPDLTSLLRPKPNMSILGIRPKIWIYNITRNAKKGPLKWIKKYGEPPVLFSSVKVDYNRDIVSNRLENKGFFVANTSADTTIHGKKASLTYLATAGPRYLINTVNFTTDSSDLGKAVHATAEESQLKIGDSYDLDVIKVERERIDSRLKEQGFYYFSPENLIIQVDSTTADHKVDLYMNIKDATTEKAKDIYKINNIFIYPNFKLRDTVQGKSPAAVKYKDFYVIDRTNMFKPAVFERTMFFYKGDTYNRADHNLSLSRLTSLGTFKFVKNQFIESDTTQKALDAYYYLTPMAKKSIRAEITGRTNSANFTGSEFTLSWRNRNAFRGAELLTLSAYVATDVQVSGNNSGDGIFRYGTEANLSIPRFLTPFKLNTSSAYIPRTKIVLGYDRLERQSSYKLNSFRTSLGYTWKESLEKEHQLTVLGVTYVHAPTVTDAYKLLAATNSTYRNAIEDQFIIGPNYNFNYTNTARAYKKNTFYFNANLDMSANLLGLIQGAKEENEKKLFGTPYSQYVRGELDFRHYYKLGLNSQWASRLIMGYGEAYGNSRSLPFVKQFFIGGTNSLRAFRARSLGPGIYRDPAQDSNDTISADQSGDIKLEFNTEFRPKLFSIVRGALFLDAGNIWLLNNDTNRSGAKFTKDFMKELAVGTGAGVRIDASILILRLDLAFPLRKPWLPEGERWVFDEINFGNKEWRKDNLVLNLAIGYPF
ncbi:translocation and assembly module lipoprotein TamL [Arcticibacter svalbardensis]|uniref:translocation and assembly module lipoprotein TamL n=1 Tax=Arcticibacter svalbardensis TaxID=1288027 RepID=UPI001F1F1816|nr:BamA/TamA family outer membrane protein [Arcticibacter svalbardensis]